MRTQWADLAGAHFEGALLSSSDVARICENPVSSHSPPAQAQSATDPWPCGHAWSCEAADSPARRLHAFRPSLPTPAPHTPDAGRGDQAVRGEQQCEASGMPHIMRRAWQSLRERCGCWCRARDHLLPPLPLLADATAARLPREQDQVTVGVGPYTRTLQCVQLTPCRTPPPPSACNDFRDSVGTSLLCLCCS